MIIPIYLYWDDSRQLHEIFGTKIGLFLFKRNPFDALILNFRYQDFGEILYMSFIAFTLLIVFLICWKLSDEFERYFLQNILKLFIIFGFFSIIVDSIHQLTQGLIYDFFTIFEDGGEMIPISFITAFFFKYLISNRNKYI